VTHGAGLRVRPVMMTGVSTIAGLLPIMFSSGTGAEVVSRIAAPMVGGMLSAMVLTLLVLPVVYYLWRGYSLKS
jgi:Cu(I)/Ag(I) efflux system membrane protein CusA/SilA